MASDNSDTSMTSAEWGFLAKQSRQEPFSKKANNSGSKYGERLVILVDCFFRWPWQLRDFLSSGAQQVLGEAAKLQHVMCPSPVGHGLDDSQR